MRGFELKIYKAWIRELWRLLPVLHSNFVWERKHYFCESSTEKHKQKPPRAFISIVFSPWTYGICSPTFLIKQLNLHKDLNESVSLQRSSLASDENEIWIGDSKHFVIKNVVYLGLEMSAETDYKNFDSSSLNPSFSFLQGERTSWEYHTVILYRVAGYGFGIAVVCWTFPFNLIKISLMFFNFSRVVATILILPMETLPLPSATSSKADQLRIGCSKLSSSVNFQKANYFFF